jgi:hypothetical protein
MRASRRDTVDHESPHREANPMEIETVGRVVDGKIVVDDYQLEEGSLVKVTIGIGDGGPALTPEMEAELDESIAQADRGEGIDGYVFLEELRALERKNR